jgi:hypothetical protein
MFRESWATASDVRPLRRINQHGMFQGDDNKPPIELGSTRFHFYHFRIGPWTELRDEPHRAGELMRGGWVRSLSNAHHVRNLGLVTGLATRASCRDIRRLDAQGSLVG